MTRVQKLKAAGSTNSVKFLEMTRIHSKSPDTIICIFEGEDEKYYGCRLSTSFGDEHWKGINTGGRDHVLDLRDKILNHSVYKKCKFLCFIDRDYEDWFINPDPDRIYVTPCYSVENLYANETCLNRILSAEFNVTDCNDLASEHSLCIKLFNERMSEAANHALAFNAWAMSRSIMVRDNKPPIRIFLNDVQSCDLVDLSLKTCTLKYDPNNVNSLFKKLDNSMLDQNSLSEALQFLSNSDPIKKYRGKQQLQIFKSFLKALKADYSAAGNIIFNKKNKLKIEIENEKLDILSTLSQYAQTPDCLRTFLHKKINVIAA
ncbi:DUF4435 domain-containing protein [Pseudomonas sp. S5D5]|uniref:DUF4435 domain-containing protein n=1 Tax=Pseudomonas sp. S5D5 TaxID=2083056 RepID=UPI000D0FF46E|nr:DUF4435 domain-containing protein [Pseudomonas sp. S5D5]